MMKQPEQGWGSCPVGGRDWGTSECCHDSTMKELMQRFRQAREDAGTLEKLATKSITKLIIFAWKLTTCVFVQDSAIQPWNPDLQILALI